jgi:hypothetical protein
MHAGTVGAMGGQENRSYYSFSTAAPGLYTIVCSSAAPSGTNLDFYMHEAEFFPANEGVSKRYYESGKHDLIVEHADGPLNETTVTYNLTVAYNGTGSPNEGSKNDPVLLTVGTVHAGCLGSPSMSYNSSYYYFEITSSGTYSTKSTDKSPDSWLYKSLYGDSTFTAEIANSQPGETITDDLDIGTYYLEVFTPYTISNVIYNLIVQ